MRLVKRQSSVYQAGVINKRTDKNLLMVDQYRIEYNFVASQSTAPQRIIHWKVIEKSKSAAGRLGSE